MSAPVVPRSHLLPRTRQGRAAVVVFVVVFLLAMPPLTHTVWNRVEPWLLGVPFFFGVLLVIYCALIGVLIWAYRKGL